jgi:hypothetical protein
MFRKQRWAATGALVLVILTSIAPFTVAQAGMLYNINLAGHSTAIGTLDWAGDLSSDGAFSRELSDINALSITVAGVTWTAADELGPFGNAEYEVTGGELVRFDATLKSGLDALYFGVQATGDGGLSSDRWEYEELSGCLACGLLGTYTLTEVPEPTTASLLALGLVGLAAMRRRAE